MIGRPNTPEEQELEDILGAMEKSARSKASPDWFGEGPELSVLRMLGLFDRPADEKALGALLKRLRFLALQSH
jgi:hypothetical protein